VTASGGIDALIPVKPLQSGKQRLGSVLGAAARAELVRAMLADLLDALGAVPAVRTRWVVSRDAEVLSLAESLGARALAEPADIGGLNGALEWGRAEILAHDRPAALLVLPADLPSATSDDLRAFVMETGSNTTALVRLCPSPDGGTNALLLRPPDAIPFMYGPHSAQAHARLAAQRKIGVERVAPPGLQVDVDAPEELRERVRRLDRVPGARTRAALASLGLTQGGAG